MSLVILFLCESVGFSLALQRCQSYLPLDRELQESREFYLYHQHLEQHVALGSYMASESMILPTRQDTLWRFVIDLFYSFHIILMKSMCFNYSRRMMRKGFCSEKRDGEILGGRNGNHWWGSFVPFHPGEDSDGLTENPEKRVRLYSYCRKWLSLGSWPLMN